MFKFLTISAVLAVAMFSSSHVLAEEYEYRYDPFAILGSHLLKDEVCDISPMWCVDATVTVVQVRNVPYGSLQTRESLRLLTSGGAASSILPRPSDREMYNTTPYAEKI